MASRRVSVRPAPDGMAYLTVLAPVREVVGAHAALRARAQAVVGGAAADERPDGRGTGAVMADTTTRPAVGARTRAGAAGRGPSRVMTDRGLLGTGDPRAPVMEPARIPGRGPVPAPVARRWVRDGGDASVWLRRLYTGPDGRDLVAMDCRRRLFTGCSGGCSSCATTPASPPGATARSRTRTTANGLTTAARQASAPGPARVLGATWSRRRRGGATPSSPSGPGGSRSPHPRGAPTTPSRRRCSGGAPSRLEAVGGTDGEHRPRRLDHSHPPHWRRPGNP